MGILSHAGNFDASAENETKPLIEGEIGPNTKKPRLSIRSNKIPFVGNSPLYINVSLRALGLVIKGYVKNHWH